MAKGVNISLPATSPDGKYFAYARYEGQGAGSKFIFVVQELQGGPPRYQLTAPPGLAINTSICLGWAPDGRSLTFLADDPNNNATHLYMQPLSGGPPVQLTHFDTEPALLCAYAWSRSGKKLALSRGPYNFNDIVMFSGFR